MDPNEKSLNIVNKKKCKQLSLILIALVIGFQLFKTQNIYSITFVNRDATERNQNSHYDSISISGFSINQIKIKRSEAIRLSDNDNKGSFHPDIATDSSGNVHLVWHDVSTPKDEIFYRKYFNNNDSWSDVEILSNITVSQSSNYPILKIDTNDFIHVLWRDVGYPSTLNYRYFNGTVWSKIEIVTQIAEVTLAHDLVSYNDSMFFVWNNKSSFGVYELYYKIYNHKNNSWSLTTQLTINNFTSISPKVALDSQQKISDFRREKPVANSQASQPRPLAE